MACILRDLIHAVEYLHNEGKIHRDFKDGKAKNLGIYIQTKKRFAVSAALHFPLECYHVVWTILLLLSITLLKLKLQDDLAASGTGTVVVRSPRGVKSSSLFSDQSTLSSSTFASMEDASTSGTFVYRGQHDDLDSPRTPKSRLGIQERTSSASLEDSASNLAEAKAALQGVKKGNAKERSGLGKGKGSKDGQEMRRTDQSSDSPDSSRHSRDYVDALKAFPRSRQASDEESSAKMSSLLLSAPLSTLLIPSLKEAVGDDDSEGSLVREMTNSFMEMERLKPGSFEVLMSRMLQRLASSKEPSVKDLQDLATHVFTKGKTVAEQTSKLKKKTSKTSKQAKEHTNND
ncbi:putative serine/threonine-protein kinase svkA-like [Heracleum sosnowskyi]|uniref:Serine/threonine-protein kinase svkA-like n=1 Tax=Heracleum sosnowskyi TaxID=360622 RepID=A0AAD8HJ99_9APIA|nr:putative serine/threonine-protein kinase svkA-like [Heracleum sosnowskyi]